ncbi:MAG: hypothetical protein JRE40_11065 [Deltaproteobacteria bacterium]|nr:hypothetical protein [Deltaproteobacteria bacterium]MBW2674353.1 hypothetical protein [Deltaproteobacteria bacterium]
MMKVYHGKRVSKVGGQPAYVDGRPLKHVVRHSPDGFQWGYGGSGPSDLALSILTDCLGKELAEKYYQQFKRDFVAKFGDEWEVKEEEIREWLATVER